MSITQKPLVSIILCGGRGTRIWPLSTPKTPKQFFNVPGGKKLFDLAVERAVAIGSQKILVITNHKFIKQTRKQISNFTKDIQENIIIISEPVAKNTAASVLLGCLWIEKFFASNAILQLLTTDQIINTNSIFKEDVSLALKNMKDDTSFLYGIKPDNPNTQYGYIKIDFIKNSSKMARVLKFVEKPNLVNARKFFKSGKYVWNSGMGLFNLEVLLKHFKLITPDIFSTVTQACTYDFSSHKINISKTKFSKVRFISFDFAILEKIKSIKLIIANFEWLDIGNFESFGKILNTDKNKNRFFAEQIFLEDSQNNIIFSTNHKKIMVGTGLKNMIIIDTKDHLLICDKANLSQALKYQDKSKL